MTKQKPIASSRRGWRIQDCFGPTFVIVVGLVLIVLAAWVVWGCL